MNLGSLENSITFGGWFNNDDDTYQDDKSNWVDTFLSQKSVNLLISNDTTITDDEDRRLINGLREKGGKFIWSYNQNSDDRAHMFQVMSNPKKELFDWFDMRSQQEGIGGYDGIMMDYEPGEEGGLEDQDFEVISKFIQNVNSLSDGQGKIIIFHVAYSSFYFQCNHCNNPIESQRYKGDVFDGDKAIRMWDAVFNQNISAIDTRIEFEDYVDMNLSSIQDEINSVIGGNSNIDKIWPIFKSKNANTTDIYLSFLNQLKNSAFQASMFWFITDISADILSQTDRVLSGTG